MKLHRLIATFVILLSMYLAPLAAQAADPVAGRQLFLHSNSRNTFITCTFCHGSVADPRIVRGADWTVIRSAVDNQIPGMGYIGTISDAELQDIAAYIANPLAGTPGPVVSLPVNQMLFGDVQIGTPSVARSVTLTNIGSGPLDISSIALGGLNSGDFVSNGTCAVGSTVAAGASCTLSVIFTPSAAGYRSGNFIITSNSADTPSHIVSWYGIGVTTVTPKPVVSLSGRALNFGAVQVGMTSAEKSMTLTNTGTASLTISSIVLGNSNATDFTSKGTCTTGTLAAGASCTLGATFSPAATGYRLANMYIDTNANAAGSPYSISLDGAGLSVMPTAPIAAFNAPSLSLGSLPVGQTSAVQTVTISNTGNATLSIGAISVSGAQAADFSTSGCANSSVAPGANCLMRVVFKPSIVGAESAIITVAHNAAGTPGTISLSGAGLDNQPPAGNPVVSFSPASLNYSAQQVSTTSAVQTVTISNTGTSALNVTGLSVSGTNAADFSLSGGTCATGLSVAVGASCTAQVSFTPTASGSRSASLNLLSNATGSQAVALSGIGVSDSNGLIQLTQNGLVIYKIKVEDNGNFTKIVVKNISNSAVKVQAITFLVDANYRIDDQCSGKTLRSNSACDIGFEYKAPKLSSATAVQPGMMKIMTDSGAVASFPIDLEATSTAPAAIDQATPKASGGCTIGGNDQLDLSLLMMLIVGAGVLIVRYRKGKDKF